MMPISFLSIIDTIEPDEGPLVDMLRLWLRPGLGCCQKWFLMALNFESVVENPGSESKS